MPHSFRWWQTKTLSPTVGAAPTTAIPLFTWLAPSLSAGLPYYYSCQNYFEWEISLGASFCLNLVQGKSMKRAIPLQRWRIDSSRAPLALGPGTAAANNAPSLCPCLGPPPIGRSGGSCGGLLRLVYMTQWENHLPLSWLDASRSPRLDVSFIQKLE